jgi:hypothetical protein
MKMVINIMFHKWQGLTCWLSNYKLHTRRRENLKSHNYQLSKWSYFLSQTI